MSLHERVTERLDEMDQVAKGTSRAARRDALMVCDQQPRWALDVWLPSLRRRAERHQADWDGMCVSCQFRDSSYVIWPCPDYLNLCTEIGIEPEETT